MTAAAVAFWLTWGAAAIWAAAAGLSLMWTRTALRHLKLARERLAQADKMLAESDKMMAHAQFLVTLGQQVDAGRVERGEAPASEHRSKLH